MLNHLNTSITDLRAAWARDWARLAEVSEITDGIVRHVFDDRPEGVAPQVWEARVRKDYANSQEWFGLEPLETAPLV